MAKKDTINVQGTEIILLSHQKEDYISLTDMAKYKNAEIPATVISPDFDTFFQRFSISLNISIIQRGGGLAQWRGTLSVMLGTNVQFRTKSSAELRPPFCQTAC